MADERRLEVDVDDSGPGLPDGAADQVFRRGWSTKSGDGEPGRGLGLALVGQVVRRYGGRSRRGVLRLGGARFRSCIGAGTEARR